MSGTEELLIDRVGRLCSTFSESDGSHQSLPLVPAGLSPFLLPYTPTLCLCTTRAAAIYGKCLYTS